jgi:murein DD-endopeptidase MepM/ murein hydrolase activator NlpD
MTGCRVGTPFDGIINKTTGKKHQAQDTVAPNIQVGTPVFAPEAGTITNFVTGKPHDTRAPAQCAGQNSPANFIEIQSDSDGALTRLYHVTILPALATMGTHVTGGQQIGTIDISGCTSGPHTHIQRKVSGVLVNFTIPCDNSHFDDPSLYYDDSDGTW